MSEPEFVCRCECPAAGTAIRCPHRDGRIITPGLWERCVVHQQAIAGACGEVRRSPRKPPSGPGTALKKLIAGFGAMTGLESCGCGTLAAQMDRSGEAWCLANVEAIVTKMVNSRSMLVNALKARPGIAFMAGVSIDNLPDKALRLAAAALLDQAIVESRAPCPLPLVDE